VKAVLQTNDLVMLSLAQSVLEDAGIGCVVLDQHMSAVDGSIGAIPRRLCVADEDEAPASRLIAALDAGSWAPELPEPELPEPEGWEDAGPDGAGDAHTAGGTPRHG
jgi:hypothetical protein